MAQPEHKLQVQIVKYARDCVACPHFFFAVDRSQKHGDLQHVFEAARGIRTGQPDTCLLWDGRALFVELKVAPNKPSDAQIFVLGQIKAAGSGAEVAYSVTDYHNHCLAAGVPLRSTAELHAEHLDRLLEASRAKIKTPARAYKPRAPKASAAKIKASNEYYARTFAR